MAFDELGSLFKNKKSLFLIMGMGFWSLGLLYLSCFNTRLLRFGFLFLLIFSAYCYFAKFLLKNRNFGYVALVGCSIGLWGLSVFMHGIFYGLLSIVLLALFLFYYYGMRFFFKDSLIALFAVLVLLIFSSHFNYVEFAMYALGILFIFLFLYKRRDIKSMLIIDIGILRRINLIDALFWVIFFGSIICLFYRGSFGIFAVDRFHPLYELSIGRSFQHSYFSPGDLSYAGKVIRFHFLSTKIPLYFSKIFGISLLESIYFIMPMFFAFVFFLLFNFFFAIFPTIRIPLWFLLFFPGYCYCDRIDTFFFRAVLVSGSYFLGYILFILALYFVMSKKYGWFFIAASILILVKASFFLTLFGGEALFLLLQRNFKYIAYLIFPLGLLFLLGTYLFLSGAHGQNLWIICPSIFYYWKCGIVSTFWFVWFVIVFLSMSFVFFSKIKENQLLLLLAATAISGILGTLLVTECTETNSFQFYVAAYFCVAIVFWHVFDWLIKKFFSGIRFPFRSSLTLFILIPACTMVYKPFEVFSNVLRRRIERRVFDADLVDAYLWFNKHTISNGIVLFGKQYEFATVLTWMSEVGFIRSALSGKQMYCEERMFKGIIMEPKYAFRFAQIVHFYKNFVVLSDNSKERLRVFCGSQSDEKPVLPLSQSVEDGRVFSHKMLHKLSFGKEWYGKNMMKRVVYECHLYLKKFKNTQKWARDFLRQTNIGYIVLEYNDKPGHWLQTISEKVYENSSIMILKVKRELL